MAITDEIRARLKALREDQKRMSAGQALFELNRWKGEERAKLDAEYNRRKAEIDARQQDVTDGLDDEVLRMVAEAVATGTSRSTLRLALGKPNLQEVDKVIAVAKDHFKAAQQEQGVSEVFVLTPTGKTHAQGWPMYAVTFVDTDEMFEAVYLVTTGSLPATRRNMRLMPSPAGSAAILDRLWDAGVGQEMFNRGKASVT